MTKANVHAGRGAGKYRDPWEIRRFLSLQDTNMLRIAEQLGVKYPQVQETVKGIRNDRRVLAYLRDMGCPLNALSLPEDLKAEMAPKHKWDVCSEQANGWVG